MTQIGNLLAQTPVCKTSKLKELIQIAANFRDTCVVQDNCNAAAIKDGKVDTTIQEECNKEADALNAKVCESGGAADAPFAVSDAIRYGLLWSVIYGPLAKSPSTTSCCNK